MVNTQWERRSGLPSLNVFGHEVLFVLSMASPSGSRVSLLYNLGRLGTVVLPLVFNCSISGRFLNCGELPDVLLFISCPLIFPFISVIVFQRSSVKSFVVSSVRTSYGFFSWLERIVSAEWCVNLLFAVSVPPVATVPFLLRYVGQIWTVKICI